MRAFSHRWSPVSGWSDGTAADPQGAVQLLLAFGPVDAPPQSWFDDVAARWPNARLVYSTAGGQIDGLDVVDADVVVTGLAFERARVHVVQHDGAGILPSAAMGSDLAAELAGLAELRHVLLFLDGLYIDGSEFTATLTAGLPAGVSVSGGLASDGVAFVRTGVGVDGPPAERRVVAVALCGASLAIGTGSAGGWEPFGPERVISRAYGTTVLELDDQRALDIYRRYLGDLAAELPGSALLFPLALTAADGAPSVVRTILGIDEAEGSLRFAGAMPQGYRVRLMRSTNDSILDGAHLAASAARAEMDGVEPAAMFCVSCIGRREVLRSRVEEEVEEVSQLAPGAVITGYYSNGEISPPSGAAGQRALLHNQTMTITAIGER
ncbi:MAG: FIST C-terminal domain-containing protein [Gemmatimonadaceae bacterium]|nr:FIST C-terminal domain-containing protein [Gemmatimonadaceae bacterium]